MQNTNPLTEAERIAHLLSRTGFGARPGDADNLRQTGAAAFLEQQLNPQRIDDSAADARLADYEGARIKQNSPTQAPPRLDPVDTFHQLQGQKLVRALHSRRQLQEVMVDFWFNHFNINADKGDALYLLADYEHNAIRPHALGKFKDLLLATAKHPAMLIYLDNALSTSPNVTGREREIREGMLGINENYARELMELHTLGVDGGYTQRDVEEVARCFTGWTIRRFPQGIAFTNDTRGLAGFTFDAAIHDAGDKVVLDQRIPSGGRDEGEAVLDILVNHPSTGRFIATKLVRKFVSDTPPPSLVSRVAQVFMESNGDIRAMLRVILSSEEFSAPAAFRAKAKSPFEAIVSMLRALDAEVDSAYRPFRRETRMINGAGLIVMVPNEQPSAIKDLAAIISRAGQPLYRYAEPTGFPDNREYWMDSGTFLERLTFALKLTENQIPGVVVDFDKLASGFDVDSSVETAWQAALGSLTGAAGGRLVHLTSAPNPETPQNPPDRTARLLDAITLALGSPEFQHR